MGGRGGGHYFSRVPNSLEGCDGWGEYYISKPRRSSGKIWAPGGPSLVLKEDILFLEIVYFCIFGGAAKLRWGACSAR